MCVLEQDAIVSFLIFFYPICYSAMGGKLSYHERLGDGHSGEVFRVTWKSKNHGYVEAAAKKIKYEGEITESARQETEF